MPDFDLVRGHPACQDDVSDVISQVSGVKSKVALFKDHATRKVPNIGLRGKGQTFIMAGTFSQGDFNKFGTQAAFFLNLLSAEYYPSNSKSYSKSSKLSITFQRA